MFWKSQQGLLRQRPYTKREEGLTLDSKGQHLNSLRYQGQGYQELENQSKLHNILVTTEEEIKTLLE